MNLADLKRFLNPIKARLMNVFARAVINSLKEDSGLQKAQIRILSSEVLDNVYRVSEYGFKSVPLSGAEAAVIFMGGDRGQGFIIATHDARYGVENLQDGEVAIYSHTGDRIVLKNGNIIEIAASSSIEINCPKVTISGDLSVKGSIASESEVVANSMTLPIHLTTHKHPTAATGSPSPPIPGS